MLNALLTLGFFIALGALWRYVMPNGITPDALKKPINTIIIQVLLPIVVFFTLYDLPLNLSALRILLYVLATTLISLGAAWFWLLKTPSSGKTKGAYLIAAVFGNVVYLGLPLNKLLFPDWTMRVAIEYMLVANIIVLFSAGVILARNLADAGKTKLAKTASAVCKDYRKWLREPIIWAAILGWIINLTDAGMPTWLSQISTLVNGALVLLLLFSVGLSLNWTPKWNSRLVELVPVVVIQLVLVPALMWGLTALFGSAGVQTTKSLLLDSMMPASLFGFVMCERYKLDSEAYALAFTGTSVIALITVPLWYYLIL